MTKRIDAIKTDIDTLKREFPHYGNRLEDKKVTALVNIFTGETGAVVYMIGDTAELQQGSQSLFRRWVREGMRITG